MDSAQDKTKMIESLPTLYQWEQQAIETRLMFFKGSRRKVALSLGVSIKTIYNKLSEYGRIRRQLVDNHQLNANNSACSPTFADNATSGETGPGSAPSPG